MQHDDTTAEGALAGVRVVEVGLLVQGPQAAAFLAQMGASVTKVELPGVGDQARWLPVTGDDARSAYYEACNRGKRSATVDLRTTEGREVFLRLAEQADVVITNFRPGTMDAWGLGWSELSARNPRLVYAIGSAYGAVGAAAGRPGADLGAQAAGGLVSAIGADGDAPSPVGVTVADHISGQNLVAGVLSALFARERTGRGQRVETSLLAGQLWAQASEYTYHLLTGRVAGRANRTHPLVPGIYALFPTADGWLAIVGVSGKARLRFFDVLGAPHLATDEFMAPMLRAEQKQRLYPQLDEHFAARTTAEWCALLAAADVRHAPVRDHAEVAADPEVWDNGFLVRTDDGAAVGPPVRLSDTPARVGARAPELGRHTEEVLLELGYGWDEIMALGEAGAV